MTPRRIVLFVAVAASSIVLAAAVASRRADSQRQAHPGVSAVAMDASTCRAMWERGLELAGMAGGRSSRAYFDTWAAPSHGEDDLVSGIVLFPDAGRQEALADGVVGLTAPLTGDSCMVRFTGGEGIDESIWQLRIDSHARVTGTRRLPDGREEPLAYDIVPETGCEGEGEWRTFSSPDWPITFDYPASWKVTADEDDVNLECPSVASLARGGSFLTFERGRFPPPDAIAIQTDAFIDPYWFVRRAGGDWRVKDVECDVEAAPAADDPCYPARRSERHGMTVLQGAAGEHRLYRTGVGYLGQGGGILRYLWILDDRWVSLDSTSWSHYDDVGRQGGPVLFDGDAVGDRVVRSVRPR